MGSATFFTGLFASSQLFSNPTFLPFFSENWILCKDSAKARE